jgi:hypothetical protein
MASTVATLQAAPLPTNVASMKSMVADRSIQARFGGRHGGGWGHRGFGSWGYRGRGWGGSAFAGALIGGAIASSAYGYYGSGPYYGGMTPATATIRPTAVIIGKQSKNPGSLASTDLTDTARRVGAIDKREF